MEFDKPSSCLKRQADVERLESKDPKSEYNRMRYMRLELLF